MLEYAEAGPADEAELRRLLRDNPMPGLVSLSFEREPDYFRASGLEGDVHQTFLAREPATGQVVGMASRAVRTAFLDGVPSRLGYLGQARIDPAWRGRGLVSAGYARLRAAHDAQPVDFYVTTIIADNALARAAFEKERPHKPSYLRCGLLTTLLLLPPGRRVAPPPAGVALRPARREDLPALADLLQAEYARFQAAPVWTAADLGDPARCPGLRPEDVLLAWRGERLVGSLALWDQSALKQTVVRGYGRSLAVLRPLYNGAASLTRLPRLPAVGAPLPHAFLALLAVAADDPAVARALIAAQLGEAGRRGLAWAALGLCAGHPLLRFASRCFRHFAYHSFVYYACWPAGRPAVARLDPRRPLHLELAVL
ncbi:MAG: hypothetical protein RBU45_09805 [Myxococcota bacterium]|jgi:hypothetical protein|nr:hypothetical protein [Myxococcota bacterium]